MAAYLHASLAVTDPTTFEEYRRQVPAVIAAYGGRYLVRGGATHALEGDVQTDRQVLLEFPDMASLEAFYHSSEYAPLIALRQSASTGRLVAIEGV